MYAVKFMEVDIPEFIVIFMQV